MNENHHLIAPKSTISIVNESYTENEYINETWPALEKVLNTFLNLKIGEYRPFSFDETYCYIYKCVCKDYREKLYNDLISFIQRHIDSLNNNFPSFVNFGFEEAFIYLKQTYDIILQYKNACNGICAVFSYLDKNYVILKLNSNLYKKLIELFNFGLLEKKISYILDIIVKIDSSSIDFTAKQSLYPLIDLLYTYDNDYALLNSDLFLKYSKSYQIEKSKYQLLNYNANSQSLPKTKTYSQINERKRHNNEMLTDEPSCKIQC